MAEKTIYGDLAPNGTYTLYTDGTPDVTLGQTFYQALAGGLGPDPVIEGGRVWTPAGSPATIEIMCWAPATGVRDNAFNLNTTPDRTVTVATNPGGWTEGVFATPIAMPANGYRFMIGYRFPTAPTTYIHSAAAFTSGEFFRARDNSNLFIADMDDTPTYGVVRRSYAKFGSSLFTSVNAFHGYGIDVLADDGVGVDVPPNAGAASGAVAWAGSATGAAPLIEQSGSADGAVAWPGTASGVAARQGAAVGSVAWLGSATGANGEAPPWRTIAEENSLTENVFGREYYFEYPGEDVPAFARSTYYSPGDTAEFSVDYSSQVVIDTFRLGWYGGAGARRLSQETKTFGYQAAPVVIPNSNGAVTCENWTRNDSWEVPIDATPGWYVRFYKDFPNLKFAAVLFCVTDKAAKRPILVVSSDSTWHAAYNGYGGNNVYGNEFGVGQAPYRALCSTYDKPVITRDYVTQTNFFNGELATLRFLESMGLNVGYTTQEQINNDPSILDGRSLIIFSGHNEYTSQRVMDKTIQVMAAGTNILNLAANDYFWRVRFGGTTFPTTDGSTGRVMWCKKDTMAGPLAIRSGGGGVPFTSHADWTGTWQDTRWTGQYGSKNLFGDRFISNGIRADNVSVPASMKGLPIWRDCPTIQGLGPGAVFSFGPGTAGMEWDMPDGDLSQTLLSSSTIDLTNNASDINGENYNESGVYTHSITAVANGPSRIINFNTTQWGWALDNLHDRGTAMATQDAIQGTLNAIVDLGGVPNPSMVAARGLVLPTPLADFDAAYLLEPVDLPKLGAANGAVGWAGTATGERPNIAPNDGEAVGAIVWIGSATGAHSDLSPAEGSAAGAVVWVGSVEGFTPEIGVKVGEAFGEFNFSTSATGKARRTGEASALFLFGGLATGTAPQSQPDAPGEGVAYGTVLWLGLASGRSDEVLSPVGRDFGLDVRRKNSRAFILKDPAYLELRPQVKVRTPTGGFKFVEGEPKALEVYRLVPQQAIITQIQTPDGFQLSPTYVLLGEWNSGMERWDLFTLNGVNFQIVGPIQPEHTIENRHISRADVARR